MSRASSAGYNGSGEGQDAAELTNAKAFLLQNSAQTGDSLYNHLTRILTKVLNERPQNAADVLEELSMRVKQERFVSGQDNIMDRPEITAETALAEMQLKLFVRGDADAEDDMNSPLPNVMEQCYYFEQAGVGLGREEMVRIWLAMKNLVETQPVETIRFWGKIFGTQQNYFIVEVDFREGEGEEEEQEVEEPIEDPNIDKDMDGQEEGEAVEVDYIPKPVFKKPPVIPKEENRTGVNRKSYFVCNEPGQTWIRLPQATPAQISTARKIKKFFTGILDAPVVTYPPFPGNESNYLRAQIARISAGTHISPAGYYQFDEDEDEDAAGHRSHVLVNVEYEPMSIRDLSDASNWVHHVLHILPQGRTKWWNPVQKSGADIDNEDDDEEREEQEEIEPEVGPPLLTPLSDDAEMNGMTPWSGHVSSRVVAQYSVAVIHSCLWPGAHAFGAGRHFENVYVGWGHKYSPESYSPPVMPPVQTEYPRGPEITEVSDPTPEEEAALRAEAAPDLGLDAEDDEMLEETNAVEDDGGADDDEDEDD